jgi:hypothetical protein
MQSLENWIMASWLFERGRSTKLALVERLLRRNSSSFFDNSSCVCVCTLAETKGAAVANVSGEGSPLWSAEAWIRFYETVFGQNLWIKPT